MTPGTILFSSERYNIIFSDNFQRDDDNDGPYQVVNKQTNVNEFGSRAFAACLEMCVKMEVVTDSVIKEYEAYVAQKNAPQAPEQPTGSVADQKKAEVLNFLEKARSNPKPVDMNVYRQLDLGLDEPE